MRISNISNYDTYLKYVNTRQKEIAKYTEQLSSGKRILAPSDDMVALAKSLKLKATNKEIDNYLSNITNVHNRQVTAETALSNIYDAAQDARVEIVRLLNHGVLDMEDAKIVDDYLQGLKKYIVEQANTQYGDTYLFGGTKSDTPPFNADGAYQGNTSQQKVPVSKGYNGGYQADATFDGSKLNLDKIIGAIDAIHNAIENSDLSQITDDLLTNFDEGMNAVSSVRSQIGNQMKTIEDFQLQYEGFKASYNDMISKLEDTDVADAIGQLEQSKVAYEASMAVFNQNKDLSLLKYFAA